MMPFGTGEATTKSEKQEHFPAKARCWKGALGSQLQVIQLHIPTGVETQRHPALCWCCGSGRSKGFLYIMGTEVLSIVAKNASALPAVLPSASLAMVTSSFLPLQFCQQIICYLCTSQRFNLPRVLQRCNFISRIPCTSLCRERSNPTSK